MDKEIIEVFKEFDRDSKGYLNPRVMQKVLKHLGFNPSNKEIEQLIVDVDSSENGKIELDEFIEATKKLTSKTKETQQDEPSFLPYENMSTKKTTPASQPHVNPSKQKSKQNENATQSKKTSPSNNALIA